MFTSIDELILDRAAAMAEHNGASVSTVYIVGAAAQLQAELVTARDRLLNVAAGSAHTGADVAAEPTPAEPEKPAKATAKAAVEAVQAVSPASDAAAPPAEAATA